MPDIAATVTFRLTTLSMLGRNNNKTGTKPVPEWFALTFPFLHPDATTKLTCRI